MSEKKPVKNKKEKVQKIGKSRYSLLIILVMVVLIGIPTYILGDILYNAYLRQGEPIVGDRYETDLSPAITDAQRNTIDTTVSAFEEVESVSVYLQTSTFKVFVDVKPDVLLENYEGLTTRVYETVLSTLSKDTYFSQSGGQKMYDLEISVYNQTERVEGEDYHFYHLVLNSAMDEPLIQDVGNAKNQEVADRLRYEQALRDLGDLAPQPETEEETETETENNSTEETP